MCQRLRGGGGLPRSWDTVWRSVSMGTGVPPSVMTCGWEIPELNGHVFLGNRKSSFSPSILGIIIPLLDELFAAKRRTRSISMRKVKGETITRRRNRKLHLLFAHVISLWSSFSIPSFYWLVVSTPLKNMKVSYMEKWKTSSKPPTSYYISKPISIDFINESQLLHGFNSPPPSTGSRKRRHRGSTAHGTRGRGRFDLARRGNHGEPAVEKGWWLR